VFPVHRRRVAVGYTAFSASDTSPTVTGGRYKGYESCSNEGHGTHVGGIAAGAVAGVAPGAIIVPVRVLSCSGGGTLDALLDGLDFAAQDATRLRDALREIGMSARDNAGIENADEDEELVGVVNLSLGIS